MMIYSKQFNLIKTKILKSLIVLVCSLFLGIFFNPLPIFANNNPSIPQTCKMGIYLASLNQFDFANKTFDADFWLWSICPNKELNPIQSVEVINAKSIFKKNDIVLEKTDPFDLFPNTDKVYWSQAKFNVKMLYNWDLTNYPFDRHVLTIPLEDTIYDSSNFVYTPDLKNSGYKEDLKIVGWKIAKFEVSTLESQYKTNFGDPEIQSGDLKASQLLLKIYIERRNILSFLKLTAGVYIAAALCFLSFFFNAKEEIGSRINLLVGGLFSTLINMQVADSSLGTTLGISAQLSLVDKIHITTIFYIAFVTLISLYCHLIYDEGFAKKAIFFDRKICAPLCSISFIIFNLIIIFNAVKTG